MWQYFHMHYTNTRTHNLPGLSAPVGTHSTLTDMSVPIRLTSTVLNGHAVKHTQSHRALKRMLRVNTGRWARHMTRKSYTG